MGLSAWLLCAFAVSILTPRIDHWHRVVPLACALLFWATTGRAFLKALRHPLVWLPTLYFTVGVVYRFLGFSSASWGNYGLFLMMFVAYWAGLYAWNFIPPPERRRVFVVVFLAFAVNLVDQLRLNWLNPSMHAYFVKSGIYGEMNFGGTNFICSIMVFALFLLADLLNGRPNNPAWKLVLHGSLVALASFYFVSHAQSATITLCFAFAAVLFWVCGNLQPGDKRLFLRVLGTGCVLSLLVAITPLVLSWSMDVLAPVAGRKFLARLQTIQHLAENQLDTSDLQALSRGTLMMMDIDNWLSSLSSFFIGLGFHRTASFGVMERAELTGAGNHSGYMDVLPRYGLLGFVALVALTVALWKYFLNGCDRRCAVKLKIFILMLVFYNVANKVFHSNVIFSIMFLLPFLREKPGSGSPPTRRVLQGNAVTARPGGKPVSPAPSLLASTKEKR
jgi:hypothetical protein